MEALLLGSVVLNVILIVLFFAAQKRMENTSENQLEEIKALVSKIKPEKVRVEIDTSPWSLRKSTPIEEDEVLLEMWEALQKRGIVGDHVDRLAHLFGWEDYNRAPLADGRTIVWYGMETPTYIRKMLNQPFRFEEETNDYLATYPE